MTTKKLLCYAAVGAIAYYFLRKKGLLGQIDLPMNSIPEITADAELLRQVQQVRRGVARGWLRVNGPCDTSKMIPGKPSEITCSYMIVPTETSPMRFVDFEGAAAFVGQLDLQPSPELIPVPMPYPYAYGMGLRPLGFRRGWGGGGHRHRRRR